MGRRSKKPTEDQFENLEAWIDFYNKNQNKYLTEETRDFSFISLIINDIIISLRQRTIWLFAHRRQ